MRWTDGVVKLALRTRSDACGAPSLNHPRLHQIQRVNLGGVSPPFSFNLSLARGEGEGDFGFIAKILHYRNCSRIKDGMGKKKKKKNTKNNLFYTLQTEG